MDNAAQDSIRIELTAEQKAKIQQLTGKELVALQFTAEELESRIAPAMKLTGN